MVTSIYPEKWTKHGKDNLGNIITSSESLNGSWKNPFDFLNSTPGEFHKEWFRFQKNQTSAKSGVLDFSNLSDSSLLTSSILNGYSSLQQLSLVLAAGVIIIVVIIFGNTLVLVAILGSRRLKVIQNWMVASVALSDLLAGTLVLPQKLTNNLLGYWFLGGIACDICLVVDDLLRTATALSLVVMVLDGYFTVVKCVCYVRMRKRKLILTMVSIVWILSLIVSFLPAVMWTRTNDYKLGFPLCEAIRDNAYLLYNSILSFSLPVVAMAILNAKIFLTLRSENKNKAVISVSKCTNNGTEGSLRKTKNDERRVSLQDTDLSPEFLYFQTNQNRMHSQCFYLNLPLELNLYTGSTVQPGIKNRNTEELNKISRSQTSLQIDERAEPSLSELRVKSQNSNVKGSKDSENPNKLSLRPVVVPKMNRDAPRLAKSQKGMLALVVTAFVVCWLPFYVLRFCQIYFDLQLPRELQEVVHWTGYCNSALNPVIYSFFNRDFKVAFTKILNCKC